MDEAIQKLKEAEVLLNNANKEVYSKLVRRVIVYMEIYIDAKRIKTAYSELRK